MCHLSEEKDVRPFFAKIFWDKRKNSIFYRTWSKQKKTLGVPIFVKPEQKAKNSRKFPRHLEPTLGKKTDWSKKHFSVSGPIKNSFHFAANQHPFSFITGHRKNLIGKNDLVP